MGTNPLKIVCLLWAIALNFASAADENSAIKFSSPESTPKVSTRSDERFVIPEITPDVRFNQRFAEKIAANVMQFAHDLGVTLDRDEFPNTQIFSPLSIMSALSILHMGANGNSYQQLGKMFSVLGGGSGDSRSIHEEFGWMLQDVMLNDKNLKRPREEVAWRKTPANLNAFGKGGKKTPNEHTIRVANGLFVQQGFSLRPDYKFAAESVYKSEVTPLDFRYQKDQAKHYINSWVNQNTLGKIPAIITDEVNSDTSMILASALYFKGFWEQPFLGSGTAETNFYPDGRTEPPVRIMMMSSGGVFPYYDSPEYDCHIIGLPYKGNQSTMYIIQPHESTRIKLYNLQNFLTGDRINDLISRMEQKTAVLAFPKFHVTNNLNLKEPLIKLGIEDIFVNGLSDLSLITDEGRYVEPTASFLPSPLSAWPTPAEAQQSPISQTRPAAAPVPRPIKTRPAATQGIALPGTDWPTAQEARQSPSIQAQQPAVFQSAWTPVTRPNQPQPVTIQQQGIALPGSTWPTPQETVSRQLTSTIQARPAPVPSTWSTAPRSQTFQPGPIDPSGSQVEGDPESHVLVDRYNEPALIVRFSEIGNATDTASQRAQNNPMQWTSQGNLMTGQVARVQLQRAKRTVTYKVESEFMRSNLPLRLKDLIISKRITKPNPGKKMSRSRRQAPPDSYISLLNLDQARRAGGLRKPQLYVDDVLHKVDFDVNEQGTEAAAATLTYLRRSGTDVAFRCDSPFMLLIRHDPTKLPLFYGKINIPLP